MNQELKALKDQLDLTERKLMDYAKRVMKVGSDYTFVDNIAIAVIKRSLSLVYGFTTLLETDNFNAALHLVRLHLDSYLRFSSLWLVDNPQLLAKMILEGEPVKNVKDSSGKKMSDSYLVKIATEDYPWIQNVYKATSGYIHLSEKHFFDTIRSVDKDERKVTNIVAKTDPHVKEERKIEACAGMLEITSAVMNLLEGWCQTKEHRN